ncbi:MAG: Gfo/Idh/MocA family oxidoreductase, partial [bacterium]|nr:Gfo/Idh/MocA family oxidoreductase [bacterium]
MKQPRVAVVGAGAFGRNHLRVLAGSDSASLVGVVDTNPDSASKAAAEFSCKPFEDWRQLVGEVDAAVVAAP